MRFWKASFFVVLLVLCRQVLLISSAQSPVHFCLKDSVAESILPSSNATCGLYSPPQPVILTEGDEISLQRALDMVKHNSQDYVALLFYASWCPFSRSFRPTFSILSSLFPSVSHFAIKESSVRPSVLSKYGVHGFPTLFLSNATLRVRYSGPRTLGSLFAFYSDVTGIKTANLDQASLQNVKSLSNHEEHDNTDQESSPFSRTRSPEKLFWQETYLALASAFVLLRLLHFIFPALHVGALYIWRRNIRNISLGMLWEYPQAYLKGAMQLLNSLKEPQKRRNLQGTSNARAWASSLASVSIGDAGSSRFASVSEQH